MRVVFERPPMFAEIDAKFRVAGKPIIFAWGDVIYNPARVPIPPHLMVHEEMHAWRQEKWGVEQWWKDYISSDAFRLDEEILAHQVEFRHLMRENGHNRSARRGHIKQVAKRLASPMYGRMITLARAKKIILGAAP